jgi:ribonuclease BN (tRNA processing enzyme)
MREGMKLKFYGTRGGFPLGGQMSCARVETDEEAFLIDLGSSLFFEDLALMSATTHVLLTHMHPDHITHLASLIIARLNVPAAIGDCLFVSPESIKDYMVFSGLGEVPGWRQTDGVPSVWCGLTLEAHQTNHPKKNYAYKLSDGTKTLVWTGDCSYSARLVDFCRGADVVVCESSLSESSRENAEIWGHMTPSLFARLINEAAPKRAVSTHFSELEPSAFADEVRRLMDRGIELITAYDGFCLCI